MSPDPLWSRRAVLSFSVRVVAATTTLTAAALSGCRFEQTATPDRRTITSGPTPPSDDADDVGRVVAAIASEERLLTFSDTVARQHPQTRAETGPLQQRQQTHVRSLRDTLSAEVPESTLTNPTLSIPTVPAQAAAALGELRSVLEQARADRYDDCLASNSGLLAQQFASLSASHACTIELLSVGR
ncbi:MAG: hypothetical protein H0T17_04870 [Propionibacteriales bacterium]|nr:hypothetical protein [Propionibacteriales bacterium]